MTAAAAGYFSAVGTAVAATRTLAWSAHRHSDEGEFRALGNKHRHERPGVLFARPGAQVFNVPAGEFISYVGG